MKKLLFIVLLISISSCKYDVPIANIEFTKIEKSTIYSDYFNIYFSSDVDLMNNIKDKNLYTRFVCFFKNEKITEENYNNYKDYALKSFDDLKLISKKEKYNYMIPAYFDIHNNKYNKNVSYITAKRLLQKDEGCLSCAVTALGYFSWKNRYISNTMCLPKTKVRALFKKSKE